MVRIGGQRGCATGAVLHAVINTVIDNMPVFSRGMPDIQWMNLDPLKLMEELSQFTSLEGFKEMLDKAQVGHAYMNRPCLNPNDRDCPLSAPNKDLRQVGMDLLK